MARITATANTLTSPVWAGDYLDREHVLPGGAKLHVADWLREDAVLVTTTAEAAATATTIAVSALTGAIPSGTILTFGSGEFAKLTAAAAAAATSLTVEALPNTIESGDTATYAGVGDYAVRSGTLVGRTWAERASSQGFGPWTSGDNDVYLVIYDVVNVTVNNDVELYRPGSVVKENLLPNFASWVAGAIAALRAAYQTTRGVA
jgi:hypothetical protein